jgi:hypothetical protein
MNTKWHLQATSAVKNEGIYEGFEWLIKTINDVLSIFCI